MSSQFHDIDIKKRDKLKIRSYKRVVFFNLGEVELGDMIEVWWWWLCSDSGTENQSTEKLSTHRAIIGTSGFASEKGFFKKKFQNNSEMAIQFRGLFKNFEPFLCRQKNVKNWVVLRFFSDFVLLVYILMIWERRLGRVSNDTFNKSRTNRLSAGGQYNQN